MDTISQPSIISVSQLNYYVKSLLDSDTRLQYLFVTGEISNLTDHYSSGHIYLSLKDDKAVVKAVVFSFYAGKLRFKPANGMKVLVRGRVALYEPSGQYQLYIEDMQPDGIGALTVAFEQQKKKLSDLGLFDKSHKKAIPSFPRRITVITSPTGAALQDIRNILTRRWPYAQLEVLPVLVQGDGAPAQLTAAVRSVSEKNTADIVIIGRGGGSMEDLWAFNSEELAYAVYDCPIPVISAVGHETDFTICDFVADMRAPTPSAAAELATADRAEQIEMLLSQRQYLFALSDRLLERQRLLIRDAGARLSEYNPVILFSERRDFVLSARSELMRISTNMFESRLAELSHLKARLFALDPAAVLRRGYSVVSRDGKTVSSVSDISKGDSLSIRLCDGTVSATVTDS